MAKLRASGMIEVLAALSILGLGIYFLLLMIRFIGYYKVSEEQIFGIGMWEARYRVSKKEIYDGSRSVYRERILDGGGEMWISADLKESTVYFFTENPDRKEEE